MIDIIRDNLALIMFVVMFMVIFCGYPVAFVLGGTGLAVFVNDSLQQGHRLGRLVQSPRIQI